MDTPGNYESFATNMIDEYSCWYERISIDNGNKRIPHLKLFC